MPVFCSQVAKTDNLAQEDVKKEIEKRGTINGIPVKQEETKLNKQCAALGALLSDVVVYNKDKMLNHSRSNNSGWCEGRADTYSGIPNGERNKKLVSPEGTFVSELMPDASGDAYIPNSVCVSDLQLESKLTEDFRREMEKRRIDCSHKPKSTKWSYTEALQSLQNFMENENTNKDSFAKSDVVEEQNTNKSTEYSRTNDDRKEDTEIKTDYGSLLESVGKLLDQIYTKYSTVMLDGRGNNIIPHNLENYSRAKLEVTEDLCIKQGNVQESSHLNTDLVKFKEKKINITENFATNQGKSSYNYGKYKSDNIKIAHGDRPEEQMRKSPPRVEKCKSKEKKIQYPNCKWQQVEEDNEMKEENRRIVRAELLKELRECDEKLKELYSEESFSSDNESRNSTGTSSESTEDSSTENAKGETSSESDYDSDSERYYGMQEPLGGGGIYQTDMGQDGGYNETDFGMTGNQIHNDDYGFYSQQQSTPDFAEPEQQSSYACNNIHDAHHTQVPNWYTQSHGSDWYPHYWTSSYAYNPMVGQDYISYLKHYRHCHEQAAKYYSDLAICYQTNCNLQDTYQLQSSYIKEMLKKE